jgi:hypothetical protein
VLFDRQAFHAPFPAKSSSNEEEILSTHSTAPTLRRWPHSCTQFKGGRPSAIICQMMERDEADKGCEVMSMWGLMGAHSQSVFSLPASLWGSHTLPSPYRFRIYTQSCWRLVFQLSMVHFPYFL